MNTTMFEPMLSRATIKALDGVAKKVSKSEKAAENAIGRLLSHWNEMKPEEKEHVASIVIGTATTAVAAIVALRRRARSPVKSAAKSLVKRVTTRKK